MRFRAGQAGTQLTLFTRSGTTGWTADGEYLLGTNYRHGVQMMPPILPRRWSILTMRGYLFFLRLGGHEVVTDGVPEQLGGAFDAQHLHHAVVVKRHCP